MQSITSIFKNVLKVTENTVVVSNQSSPSDRALEHVEQHVDAKKVNVVDVEEASTGPEDVESVSQSSPCVQPQTDPEIKILRETVFDLIRVIQDPEKPETLEDLSVVNEDDVFIQRFGEEEFLIRIEFVPTIPHCSLASLIGLSLRTKLQRNLPEKHKLDIYIKEGTHETRDEINKQINDKERIAAAMENPNLKKLIDQCVEDGEN